MAIQVKWYNEEHTILIWSLANSWEWEDFHQSQKQLNALVDEVNHPVAVIVDSRQATALPTNIILNVKRGVENDHKQISVYVIVGMNLLMKTFYNTLVRGLLDVYAKRQRTHVTATFDEAIAYIESRQDNTDS